MKENALKELYIDELRDIYNAENQLTKALPKTAKAATSDELRAGFEEHFEQTKGHVERLEQIFQELGEKPTGKKCKGMEGLVEEGDEMIEEDELEGEALDAGLISAAQRVEHYEIAAYGCVLHLCQSSRRERCRQIVGADAPGGEGNGSEADQARGENQCRGRSGRERRVKKQRESGPGLIVHDDGGGTRWPAVG